jgi:Predicted membrane protein (DUF2127)
MNEQRSSSAILLIGLFKVLKALLLVAVGIGAFRLLHKDVANVFIHWIEILRVDPENRFIHPLLSRVLPMTSQQLKELGAGTFFYAGLLLTERVGLLCASIGRNTLP